MYTPYSGICQPPSDFSEAAANQREVRQRDNLRFSFLAVEETDISTFLHLGAAVTVDPVLIFKAFRYYSEKIHLKLINNEVFSSLSGTNSKITASITQISPPSEFKRKDSICNTTRQSLLSLFICFFLPWLASPV